jgi:hypothetical protein
MANEIHNYPLEIYKVGDNDFFDVDTFNGVGYDTAKIKGMAINPGKFAMLTPSSYVTGTTEQSILDGSASGSLSVPANGFNVGDSFRLTMRGYLGAHNNDQITININTNGVALISTGPITLPSVTYKGFELIVDFTIYAIGPSMVAGLNLGGGFTYNKDASNIYEGQDFIGSNSFLFDTTIPNVLDVTAQFSSSNPANFIQSYIGILEKTR